MSHISRIKTKIKNANRNLVIAAVKALAKELNAEIVDEVRDYYGNRTKVDIGIKTQTFHRGVGFTVDKNGEVKIVGDFYRIPQTKVENLQNQFNKNYTHLAMKQSLQQLGYQVIEQRTQNKIYLKAYAVM